MGAMPVEFDIPQLPAAGAVMVAFDVSFVMLAIMAALLVVPLLGAMFLGIWCRMLDIPTPRFKKRWLAYASGCGASLLMTTLMMLMVKDAARVPGWFLASLFGQAIAVHAIVVPLVLGTRWGRQIHAQAMTLILYGAVLVIAMAPIIIHVRKAVDRGEWAAELQRLYRAVTGGKGMQAALLPETLEHVEEGGWVLLLLPGHKRDDVTYLGDYIQDNYPSMLTEQFVACMPSIKDKSPGISPLIWRNPKTTRDHRIAVCSYDGTVSHLTRREFDYHLSRTLLELDKVDPDAPVETPETTIAPTTMENED